LRLPVPPIAIASLRTRRVAAIIVTGGTVLLAGAAYWRSHSPPATPAVATSVATPAAAPAAKQPQAVIIGSVDSPSSESIVGTVLEVNGWALASNGVQRVEVRVDGRAYDAAYGVRRPDILMAKPGYPDSASAGFSFRHDFDDLALERHDVEIVAIDRHGTSATLARKSLVPPAALTMWRAELDERPRLATRPFRFMMMTSGVEQGGASEVNTQYRDYVSRTQSIGISVPILYLRTTTGKGGDWHFDPHFDLAHKCGNRVVAEDNLAGVIRYSITSRTPVQFILNGGIWSDASCETPQWDLTDQLEQDRDNCQWTERDEVFPDSYLKGLPGSTDSPDLARSLTYNVYASKVRQYKRRNLEEASRIIAAFARDHPDLFVGVVLDADTYMNPFFRGKALFDYNPGMLRQFRAWLRGSGPYAGRPEPGVPDLSAYRRAKPLTLADVNAIARKHWKTWSEVEPPRRLPGFVDPLEPGERPVWDDPWYNLWDKFRKHVVGLHYDELSTWAHEAGIPRQSIFSAQGLIHDDPAHKAFAVRIDSPSRDYDSAGVSVEGSIPRDGHLGAILYGRTARNDVELDNGHSLFATIERMDDGWAIVEYNNTDLRYPSVAPDYAMAYATFRDAFNYGATEVSAMAWNGSNGLYAGQPGYVPYTAWRNTPAEYAMRDFLVAHADVPLGAKLWTFGSVRHANTDGWTVTAGSVLPGNGYVDVVPQRSEATLVSPPDQVIRPESIDRLIVAIDAGSPPLEMRVAAQTRPDTPWIDVGRGSPSGIALSWPPTWLNGRTIVERLRLTLSFADGATKTRIARVLLYPRAASAPATVRDVRERALSRH